jgi:lantibiotic modifying enzyme
VHIYGDDLDGNGPRSADISALGYTAGEESPFMWQRWDASGTDAMRLVAKRGSMPLADCLPELDGNRIPATKYVGEIERGFGDTYDLLVRRRNTLRKVPGGPLSVFRTRPMRHVFRPTAHYVQLLTQSWHPGHTRDANVLDSFLRRCLSTLDPGCRRGTRF